MCPMYFGGLGGFGGLDHRGILSALISMTYKQPMCIIYIYVIKTSEPGVGGGLSYPPSQNNLLQIST